MKRCEFFIIYNAGCGNTALKVKGYMFQKCGHWFTVRRKIPSENHKKWIISDFVTGVIMTDTDSSLKDVLYAVTETMVNRLVELYRDNTVGIYDRRSSREALQRYAEMIHEGMYKDNPESKILELHQSQAEELFN